MSLIIVDTGCANLSSVKFAFDRAEIAAEISEAADVISAADRVVIPGVGAAPFAMQSIKNKGLLETLQNLQQPVLGICLGMQLLFNTLNEGGTVTQGLGLIDADICALDTSDLPSPHMGWNTLEKLADDPLLEGVLEGSHSYFVHGYCAPTGPYTLATTTYGQDFSAVVRQNNIWGCQFHPERSSKTGAKILQNFAKVTL